eukprot:10529904-Alexandrium_andersonii.AAC.1
MPQDSFAQCRACVADQVRAARRLCVPGQPPAAPLFLELQGSDAGGGSSSRGQRAQAILQARASGHSPGYVRSYVVVASSARRRPPSSGR